MLFTETSLVGLVIGRTDLWLQAPKNSYVERKSFEGNPFRRNGFLLILILVGNNKILKTPSPTPFKPAWLSVFWAKKNPICG